VARNVASLIPDGATLQTGIGGIPEAVLACLGRQARPGNSHRDVSGRRDRPDGVGRDQRRAQVAASGKAVVSFVLGTQRLFDFIHENPSFEFRSISYTNDPFVVAQNDAWWPSTRRCRWT
jgi:4-hydroxybutyrate CoA-transferase